MGRRVSTILILFVGLVYGLLRYHKGLFGESNTEQIPIYIANKAISFAALAMIALAVAARPLSAWLPGLLGWLEQDRRRVGLIGFALAGVHTLLSLAILNPAYFDKLYQPDSRMTLAGELSILTGATAMVILVWQSRLPATHGQGSDNRRVLRRLGLWVLALTAAHAAALGWTGWLQPSGWPAGMPPITLLSFVVAVAGLCLGLIPAKPRG